MLNNISTQNQQKKCSSSGKIGRQSANMPQSIQKIGVQTQNVLKINSAKPKTTTNQQIKGIMAAALFNAKENQKNPQMSNKN